MVEIMITKDARNESQQQLPFFLLFLMIRVLIIGADVQFQELYEWKSDLNRSVQEILQWHNNWLQITNENLVYINSIDPRAKALVNCSFKATFEPGEAVKAIIFPFSGGTEIQRVDLIVLYQFNSVVVIRMPECDPRAGTVLKYGCKHLFISKNNNLDCHYLKEDSYIGPMNFGRLDSTNGRLKKEFNVPGVTSVEQRNLTLGKFLEPTDFNRTYYLFEKIKDKCDDSKPCELSRLKILDMDYNLKEVHSFEHPISRYYSLANNQLTFCQVTNADDSYWSNPSSTSFSVNILVCNIYDSKVRPKSIVKLNLAHKISDWVERQIAVHNLADGSILLVYHPHKTSRKVFYRLIDPLNTQNVIVGDFIELYEFRPSEENLYFEGDIDIFLFEKNPISRDYCIIMIKFSEIVGKCIRLN